MGHGPSPPPTRAPLRYTECNSPRNTRAMHNDRLTASNGSRFGLMRPRLNGQFLRYRYVRTALAIKRFYRRGRSEKIIN